jgi:hypothetical protein
MNNTATQTKHTPGPWTQNYIFQASTNEIKANEKRIALILQYDDKQNRVVDFETCEANAKLIAAAPELLDILQRWVRLFEIQYEQDAKAGKEPQTPIVVMDAKAAIKKAIQ